MTDKNEINYHWYAGQNDEFYTEKCDSKEEAIQAGIDNEFGYHKEDGQRTVRFHICEGAQTPLDLSVCFDANQWLESAEEVLEDCCNPDDPGTLLEDVPTASLELAVRTAIKQWQTDNNVIVTPWVFTHCRNQEHITRKLECDITK